jgi:hypothetical protein
MMCMLRRERNVFSSSAWWCRPLAFQSKLKKCSHYLSFVRIVVRFIMVPICSKRLFIRGPRYR